MADSERLRAKVAPLGEAAAASTEWKPAILRDALGAAIHEREPDAILARSGELLACGIPADERSLLVFASYDITQHVLGDAQRARALLHDALSDESCRAWAPQVARARAARVPSRTAPRPRYRQLR